MNTPLFTTLQFTPSTGERALVLGGGGSTGNAWLIGVIAGLYDSGLDVTTADLTIGTSAGSTAAAQIAGATPAELYAATVQPVPQRPGPSRPMGDHLKKFLKVIADSDDIADLRRRMGAMALEKEAASDGSWQEQWRATVASRLPLQDWPGRSVLVTAVDARTGEPIVFDNNSGVDLVDAVAASCAGGGMPYRIGGNPYLDGGYRANAENADLAVGHDRVLVLSPLGGKTLHPLDWGTRLDVQAAYLREHGSRVETVIPGTGDEHVFGANAMDVSLRPAAAEAGFAQGAALADELGEFWR